MIDLSVTGVSLVFLLFFSLVFFTLFVSRFKEIAVSSYFFANRDTHWLVLGASFLTTWLSGLYAFGLLVRGLDSTWVIVYGAISILMLFVLGWFLGPLYMKLGINTLPEYFEKRFSRNCKLFLSSLYILGNVFVRLIVILVLGSVLIGKIAGVDPFSPLLFFLFVTGVYVVIGGLRAEVFASVIQGLFVIVMMGVFAQWAASHEILRGSALGSAVGLPSYGAGGGGTRLASAALGLPMIGFWFWCGDQFIVQKVLGARSEYFLRKATVAHGLLQVIPVAAVTVIGTAFLPGILPEGTPDPLLAAGPVPDIIRVGLLLAVAALLMALFASVFNSTSLLITFDFYRSFKPLASDRTLLFVGRMTTIILLLLSILMIPVAQAMNFAMCFKLLEFFVYFSALVTAVLLTSLVTRKVRSLSAILTLHVASAIILLRAAIEILYPDRNFQNALVEAFAGTGSLEFAIFVFLVTIALLFVFNEFGRLQHIPIPMQRSMKFFGK